MTNRVSDVASMQDHRPALRLVEGSGAVSADDDACSEEPSTAPSADRGPADGPRRVVITDFDDGVDAIDFMIQAFGFEDMDALYPPDGRAQGPRS